MKSGASSTWHRITSALNALASAEAYFSATSDGGLKFSPDLHAILNRQPYPDVAHGCLLEGMTLALEGRPEPFSRGRGFITPERVKEIAAMAARHGIFLAPLYNADGPIMHERSGEKRPELRSFRKTEAVEQLRLA